MKYSIYRLCRNKETVKRLKENDKTYSLPKAVYLSGMDLYSFINKIIKECPTDYALLCHDDVILPQNIDDNLKNCIVSSDNAFGSTNWAVVGNAGLEVISKKTRTFISDPHTKILPPFTRTPIMVESVDGNTMLLNLKNIRKNNVYLPPFLSGYHLYDVILCMESYKKGLICAISSWLYVIHNSPGNYADFQKMVITSQYQKYFSESFSNHIITTINSEIQIKREYKHLQNTKKILTSFENTVNNVIQEIFKKEEIELNIIIRLHKKSLQIYRLLESINILKRKADNNVKINTYLGINNIPKEEIVTFINELKSSYPNLYITDVYIKDSKTRFPRVNSIAQIISMIENDNSYSWIVDYDDFILPEIANNLQSILINNEVVIGDSYVFDEYWEDNSIYPLISKFHHRINAKDSIKIFTGKNYVPICSIMYKTAILKDIFEKNKLIGDYFEDYALILFASKNYILHQLPLPFAGISYHGDNTVLEKDRTHWDHSYVTFLAEIVNKEILPFNVADFLIYERKYSTQIAEFEGFKKGMIWKSLQKYRKIKNIIKSTFHRLK
ncbi:MAG: hypothetical protein UR45_C0014G0010 [candidate division WS6 bacterium GW2011_WS6_33_547]|nr:MAG: hypothetical protein UR36_C0012G0010 [candidate division WS6 bacterium GW2011_GWF1_33_233]KKP54477.1 MAG: hypothetical protein UR45_C0014G0010 [candidate division WS6 bacterium GW2011_WS6_33_547]OGC36557.1 MAG: hypothetical protein A2369_03600 [candidate division WS6 bacterium RIFOXYB1_FULL_33_15]